MVFNHRTSSRSTPPFPVAQLSLLALVRVAEPVALTSIFPYAYKLVLHFQIGDSSNASFYAGLLISAFSLAECLSGMLWGALSDRLGRKPILLSGCLGTTLSLLLIGFSSNFWMALAARAIGGLLNGNIGIIQTVVAELVTVPEHEPKAYAVMPFVWSIGTIIGPAIGGYFCEPAKNFPSVFPPGGLFDQYPFLLPNLICAGLLVVATIAGAFFIQETHPDMQPWSTKEDLDNTSAETPLMATAGSTANAPTNLTHESYGTFNSVEVGEQDQRTTWTDKSPCRAETKAFTRPVVLLVVALGIFTFHSMAYDTLLPIFLGDTRTGTDYTTLADHAFSGGLGLSLQEVGIVLAVNGMIALLVQGVIFPLMASQLGVPRLFFLVTVGHPLSYFIVPWLVLLPEPLVYPGIYLCSSVRNLLSIIAYPVILILLKDATPAASHLGKINGLAASVGAACRCLASPTAGFLYGLGVQFHFTPLAWWFSSAVAVIGVVQVCFMRRQRRNATVHTLARHMSIESLRSSAPGRDSHKPQFRTIQEEHEDSDDENSRFLP